MPNLLFHQITEWSKRRFRYATQASTMTHLERELQELLANPNDGEEMADIVFLLLQLAWLAKPSVDLMREIERKFDINQQRLWRTPDAQGVVEHVREADSRPRWNRGSGVKKVEL